MSWSPRRAAVVLALGGLLAGCNGLDSTGGSDGAGRVALGEAAPNISGEDAEGHALKLADFRGKVVMLSFWSVN